MKKNNWGGTLKRVIISLVESVGTGPAYDGEIFGEQVAVLRDMVT